MVIRGFFGVLMLPNLVVLLPVAHREDIALRQQVFAEDKVHPAGGQRRPETRIGSVSPNKDCSEFGGVEGETAHTVYSNPGVLGGQSWNQAI